MLRGLFPHRLFRILENHRSAVSLLLPREDLVDQLFNSRENALLGFSSC